MSEMSATASSDKHIYHVTSRADWDQAQSVGVYNWSTRGKSLEEVGFIHASMANQLPATAEFVYGGCDDELVVLVMDLDKLDAVGLTVRFEAADNGKSYPHIYAPLPCHLVDDVRPAAFNDQGAFSLI